jgi:outer membrane protein assembly factor BamB
MRMRSIYVLDLTGYNQFRFNYGGLRMRMRSIYVLDLTGYNLFRFNYGGLRMRSIYVEYYVDLTIYDMCTYVMLII